MDTAKPPIIGITRSRSDPPDPSIFGNYAVCVERVGGQVRWIRPGAAEPPEAILEAIDALVLTGGPDVDPAYYGEPLDPRTGVSEGSKLRDALEIPLVREALKRDMPVLAICRGMQVLNVAAGGSLHQHVEGHQESDQGESACHPVTFEKDSRLARLLGLDGAAIINSRHHQAVDRVAPGFVVVATSLDHIVEAVESHTHRWVFGIQCHPERAGEVPAGMQRLFEGLVTAATLRELVQQVRTQNQLGEAHG
ncbi:MAG TPA: gamma-glutamyl-gamma-aminobutyrate hydrolase family protein [Dehalococcoidia bacterium]|nr:gamma-glutamyl-gamma-aminobutyrate hydrolase family protein [Dehalococcoidia bacterium]